MRSIFHPKTTACWECLAQTPESKSPHSKLHPASKISNKTLINSSILPPCHPTNKFEFTATKLAKWIVQGNNKNLENTIITFDTKTLKTTNHTITKRPQCPECGSPGPQEIQPFVLQSQKKTFTTDGGHSRTFPNRNPAKI